MPGNSFSNTFLKCWTELYTWCLSHDIIPILSSVTSCNIYYVRQMCLGADVSRGVNQKPFNRQIDYDYIMWIDSDMVFKSSDLIKLLADDKDIVGGLYFFDGGKGYTCGKLDNEFYKKNGYMEYYTPEIVKKIEKDNLELIKVDYVGFGFLLIKKGVYEKMEYPWHRPEWTEVENQKDFSMEDVGFCMNAKKVGFEIYVDTQVVLGHEKKCIY